MMKVNIIGAGNVATHLANQLKNLVKISTVYSRNFTNASQLALDLNATAVSNLLEIDFKADLTIIMINDISIKEVAVQLPKHLCVVHTSGSIPIEVFSKFENCGILYPLQTFSKDTKVDISSIPFLLEANNTHFEKKLIEFCESYLSKNIHLTTSQLRSEIHLSAVISNNFITHLLGESESILKANGLSLNILGPLVNETIKKSFKIGPKNAQTGPAKRNDVQVMEKQFEKISNPKLKQIYKLMSELIQENNC